MSHLLGLYVADMEAFIKAQIQVLRISSDIRAMTLINYFIVTHLNHYMLNMHKICLILIFEKLKKLLRYLMSLVTFLICLISVLLVLLACFIFY